MEVVGAAKGANLNLIPLRKPGWALVGRIGSKRAQECYG
jgi:hypothetical protein